MVLMRLFRHSIFSSTNPVSSSTGPFSLALRPSPSPTLAPGCPLAGRGSVQRTGLWSWLGSPSSLHVAPVTPWSVPRGVHSCAPPHLPCCLETLRPPKSLWSQPSLGPRSSCTGMGCRPPSDCPRHSGRSGRVGSTLNGPSESHSCFPCPTLAPPRKHSPPENLRETRIWKRPCAA